MSDTIILASFCRFRKIQWDSVVKDQKVFYYLKKARKPEDAHGPFTVVETGVQLSKDVVQIPNLIRLRNANGVELNLSEDVIQLLEFIEVV